MRILQIIETLNIGGAENFTHQLSNALSDQNDVMIITTRNSKKDSSFVNSLNQKINLKELNWKKKYSLKQLWLLYREIKEYKPDVIHVHLHNSFYYVFVLSFFLKRTKVIHTIHSNINVWERILNWVNKIRPFNNRIVHVCISKSIEQEFKKKYPKLKCFHINNGIKSYQVKRSSEEIVEFWKEVCSPFKTDECIKLLAIGNISYYKNYDMLAKALKGIENIHPNVRCALIGRKDAKNEVGKIEEVKAKNLIIAGPYSNGADFLAEADALVISSHQEGMPIVALEALSLGKPIVSTPVGGMIDIIQNKFNGFLSGSVGADNFKKTIIDFIELAVDEKRKIETNCLRSFEDSYDLSLIAAQYLDIYKK